MSLSLIFVFFVFFQFNGSVIECEVVARDLGVYLDSELSMKHHVNKIASACFYHIRRLRQIRHNVSGEPETAGDFTRLIPLGLLQRHPRRPPGVDTMPPQRAQNAAARLVLGLDRRSSITTVLRDLHWRSTDSHRQLRSTTTRAAAIQRTRTQFGRRAFSVCGPTCGKSASICLHRRLQLVLPPCS